MNATEFHANRKFAETSFGKIAYVERGVGPAALFIHGFPLNGFQWRDIADDLQNDRRCLMPDLMGQGHTVPGANADRSFAGQAQMLGAFLDAVHADTVDLIGNDTGAGISQMFATMYPNRVRTWTLTNCEVHNQWPNPMLEQVLDGFESGAALAGLTIILADINLARQQFASAYEDPGTLTEESVKVYLEPMLKGDSRPGPVTDGAPIASNWCRSHRNYELTEFRCKWYGRRPTPPSIATRRFRGCARISAGSGRSRRSRARRCSSPRNTRN